MKTDRSGRTFEEYRQLYWDGQKRIDELEAGSDRTGKHYGLYGTACLYTGQLDAGPCWKCQIKKLEAKLDAVRDMSSIVLKLLQENPWPTSDTRWQIVEEMAKTNLKALGEAK